MRGVYFGDYHTATDWGLILSAKDIQPPTPKIISVNIDGRDGVLDLSRALTGELKYNNRSASFTFLITEGTPSDREELLQEIINTIHGKILQIIEPDFPEYYLLGECSIKSVNNNKSYGSFTVSANCEPYKYYVDEVNRVISASSSSTDVILSNRGRKTLTPTITVDGSVNLVTNSTSVALSTGTYKLTTLTLPPGSTIVSVSGSGIVTFSYREAIL